MARSSSRVAIVGAGPAGLTAANALADAGVHVTVFERSGHVGGLARTLELWDRPVELGPHVLANADPDATALFHGLIGSEGRDLPLRRGLQLRGIVAEYPPRPRDLVRALSFGELLAGGASLLRHRAGRRMSSGQDTREWFVSRYGTVVYDAVARPLITKLWGRDGSMIEAAYSQTIGSVAHVRGSGSTFRYPARGLSQVWNELASRIGRQGELVTNARVESLEAREDGVTLCVGGADHHVDALLWSAPLPALVSLLTPTPGDVRQAVSQLETRHCVVVHLLVQGTQPMSWATVFVGNEALKVGRITDSRFWFNERHRDEGVITMEFWCGDGDAIWRQDDRAVAEHAAIELAATGLFGRFSLSASNVTRLRHILPVPALGATALVTRIHAHFASLRRLYVLGRHGSFTYDSTLSAMAQGLATARIALSALG